MSRGTSSGDLARVTMHAARNVSRSRTEICRKAWAQSRADPIPTANPRTRRSALLPETRHFRAEDGDFLLPARIADVEVEASAFQCVGELAGTIRGNDDVRYSLRANRPHLRNRDLEIGQELEEQALELFVGPVDLVDQQDGCLRPVVGQGLEERAFQEKFLAEDFPLQSLRVLPGFLDSDRDQLLRMVPFVQ